MLLAGDLQDADVADPCGLTDGPERLSVVHSGAHGFTPSSVRLPTDARGAFDVRERVGHLAEFGESGLEAGEVRGFGDALGLRELRVGEAGSCDPDLRFEGGADLGVACEGDATEVLCSGHIGNIVTGRGFVKGSS